MWWGGGRGEGGFSGGSGERDSRHDDAGGGGGAAAWPGSEAVLDRHFAGELAVATVAAPPAAYGVAAIPHEVVGGKAAKAAGGGRDEFCDFGSGGGDGVGV